jgi:hypothetical protein
MTTAHRGDTIGGNRGEGGHSRPPLLHLRGTEYGLRIHGLRIAADGPGGAGVNGDGDRGGSGHG